MAARQVSMRRAQIWIGIGSVASALAASACCWLPLVLVAFGASTAGLSAAFERVRPWFLGATAVRSRSPRWG